MPDAYDAALSEAQAHYSAQQQQASESVGQIKTAQEQDAAQTKIDAQPSLFGRAFHFAEQLHAGVVSGAIHGVSEMAQAETEGNTWMSAHLADLGNAIGLPHVDPAAVQSMGSAVQGAEQGVTNAVSPTVDTTEGRVTQSVGQFVIGMLPADRSLAAAGMAAGVGRRILSGALAQGIAFDPHSPTVANLLRDVPALQHVVPGFMASQPGDTEWEGRLKQVVDGALVNTGVEALSAPLMAIFKGMRGTLGLAETAEKLDAATPTEVGKAPAAEPEVKPEGEPEVPPPAPKPWKAPELAAADTTSPGAGQEVPPPKPEPEPKPGEPAPEPKPQHPLADDKGNFSPEIAAKAILSIPADMAEKVRGYFADGRYAEAAGAILDRTHANIDWDTLPDGENLKGTMAAMEAHLGDTIRGAHGVTPVTSDQIIQLAKDLGESGAGDVSRLHDALTQGASGPGGLAARITSAYGMMIASARHLQGLSTAARGAATDTEEGLAKITAFQKQLEVHAAIVGQVRRSSSEIGRALWAHRALKASAEWASSKFNDITASELGPKALRKLAGDVADGNLRDVNTAARKAGGNRIMNVVKEIALNGMLSGPKTQIANFVGNAFNGLLKNTEWYLAGAIGQVRGVLMSDSEHATIRAALAHTWGQLNGLKDAAPVAFKSLLKEPDVWASSGRPVTKSIGMATEGLSGARLGLAKLLNITGQAIRYPGRLMGTVDTFNAAAGERGDLYAHSYLQAAREADAQGLSGDVRSKFLKSRQAELIQNPTTQLAGHAKEAGLYQSFQEAAQTHLGHSFAQFMSDNPVIKLIFSPFVHRPLNILRQGLVDYTPAGLANKNILSTIGKGGADSDIAIARMTLGTSALLAGYHLAERGAIVGAMPGAKNTESLSGIPSDSINIGGKWYQFSRLDPIGQWLGMSADVQHILSSHIYNPNDDTLMDRLGNMTQAATQAISESVLDKTFMGSFVRIADAASHAASEPTIAENDMQELIDSNLGKLLPFSGLQRSITEGIDPTERATGGSFWNGVWDEMKSNIPGQSGELMPRRDILGRPIERTPGYSWNPFAGAPGATDHMDQELDKLAFAVRMPKNNLAGIQLNPQQYDELIRLSTQTPLGGATLPEAMKQLTESSEWKEAATSQDNGVMLHTQMARGLIDNYYNTGKMLFEQKHPEFLQALMQAQQQKAQMMAPRQ